MYPNNLCLLLLCLWYLPANHGGIDRQRVGKPDDPMRGTVMLFERLKVGTASLATPDANCSKTMAMCKPCPNLALLLCGLKYKIF